MFHQQHEIGILMTSLCLPKYRNCMNERFLSNVIGKSFGEKTCTIELLLLLLIFTKLLKRNNFNYIFFDYYIFLLSLYLHVLFQVTRSLTQLFASSIAKLPLMTSLMTFLVTYVSFDIFFGYFLFQCYNGFNYTFCSLNMASTYSEQPFHNCH